MRKDRQALLFLAMLFSITSAQAQDQCRDILLSGVHNTYQHISRTAAKRAYLDALCDESSSQNSANSRAGGGISIFGIGAASGNVGSNRFSSLKAKYCRTSATDIADDDFSSLASATIDPYIVDNWRECMSQNGKGLHGNVDVNGDTIIFTLEWFPQAGVYIANVESDPMVSGAKCDKPIILKGTQLRGGVSVQQACERTGCGAVTFVVNTSGGGKTLKLSAKPASTSTGVPVVYRPPHQGDPQTAMNPVITMSEIPGGRHMDVSITAPVPPPPTNKDIFRFIQVHVVQLVNGQPTGPAAVGPLVTGNWRPGDKASISFDAPSHFFDGSWLLDLCIGNASGCMKSQNLLSGAPSMTPQQSAAPRC